MRIRAGSGFGGRSSFHDGKSIIFPVRKSRKGTALREVGAPVGRVPCASIDPCAYPGGIKRHPNLSAGRSPALSCWQLWALPTGSLSPSGTIRSRPGSASFSTSACSAHSRVSCSGSSPERSGDWSVVTERRDQTRRARLAASQQVRCRRRTRLMNEADMPSESMCPTLVRSPSGGVPRLLCW